MSIADKLQYLSETKTLIKEAIRNKGVNVEDTDPFRVYADKIGMIQSGGTGRGEIIDALLDDSAKPVSSDKKVIVTDIINTGQGAGALLPFDIVPYGLTSGSVANVLQTQGEYPLHVNTNNTNLPHIGYKKVGDKWEGKFFKNSFTGLTNPHDAFALIYDHAISGSFYSGSAGDYWNHKKEAVESILFDSLLTASDFTNSVARYFLTHDSKYLWAVNLCYKTANRDASTSRICIYEISIDEATGRVSAHKKSEEIEIPIDTSYNTTQVGTCSLNHYGIVLYAGGNGYNMTYVQYDEATNSITLENGDSIWAGYPSFTIGGYTKDWLVLKYSSGFRLYQGNIFNGVWEGSSFGVPQHGSNLARFGNTFYPLKSTYGGVGSAAKLQFIEMPVEKVQPTPEDFKFYEVSCYGTDVGPFMVDEDTCIMGSSYSNDCTQSLRYYKLSSGQRTESDPSRVPFMLLDDGTGYFFDNNYQISKNASVSVITPEQGSYNSGTKLLTITSSAIPYPFQKFQVQGAYSGNAGNYSRFGTLPMNYICEGDSFIFQTYFYNTASSGAERGWFYKNPAEEPIKLEWTTPRALVVGQNKAYISPAYISDTQYPLTVIGADGVKDYTVIADWNTQFTSSGVFFEFENKLYCYHYRNNNTSIGGYNCYEIVLDDVAMTATYTRLGTPLYSPMSLYITQDSMHPSNMYPVTAYHSLYSKPVLTKDGKYFIGLAGNHLTHYAKIEKHETGHPILNVYEFPKQLQEALEGQEILYIEAYYPTGFGIQLAGGFFLLCEYEQGIDIDLTIKTYLPSHKYSIGDNNQSLMHFTSKKNYWYFSAGTYWASGAMQGYAGCGKREDMPETYTKRIYAKSFAGYFADSTTGYLTGESRIDEDGKLVAKVEVLQK